MSIVFYPDEYVAKVLPIDFDTADILDDDLQLKQRVLKLIKKRLPKGGTQSIRKVLKLYKRRVKELKKVGVVDAVADAINGAALLKDRISDMLVYERVQELKDEHEGGYYIWEPSSAITPDPLHGLLYGKKFRVGTGDKDGNMPGERWGCQCGMRILTRDDDDYRDTPVHDSKAEYKRIAW